MKRKILELGIFCLLLFNITGLSAQKINTVVIDAGHGGHDTGALGKHSREKDVTLAIALKLGQYISANLKDVRVIYTRQTDEFIELFRRARIANENHADLFISIHCNANPSPTPFGTESYVMGLHRSNANLAVAKAENAAVLLEDDYVSNYDGFDPKSPEGNIFFSILQNTFLDNSLAFASGVEKQFSDRLNLVSRGVKQAGFLVLYKTAMPGVLIETGFLSNPKDEKFLLSNEGQDHIALAIYKAFREYKHQKESGIIVAVDSSLLVLNKPDSVKTLINKNEEQDGRIHYMVQFATAPEKKPLDMEQFHTLNNVMMYIQDGLCKYTSGDFGTLQEASGLRKDIIAKGYKDAFVVVFYGGKRITLKEAAQLAGK